MKTRFPLFPMITAILLSCTTYNYSVKPTASENQASLNKQGLRQTATVTLVNEEKFTAEKLRFAPDSTTWVDLHTQNVITVKTTEISNIRFISGGKGALDGFGFGFLVGAPIGAVVGYSVGDDPEGGFMTFSFPAEAKAFFGSIVGGVIGGMFGLSVGVVIGSKDIYHVEPDSLQSKPIARK